MRQRDLTHGVSDEEFSIVQCAACRLLFLNPRPMPSEMGKFYPPQYFAPSAPPRKVSRIKQWVMEDFYSYPTASLPGFWRQVRKGLLWPAMILRLVRGREILPWIGQGRLLDVGCGPGRNMTAFKDQGWDVYGLDASDAAVTSAREQFGDRVSLGNLDSVRYQPRSFDVVLFSHSLEHMYDPLSMLKEAWRILTDQGRLVITLPNIGSLEARLFGRWWFPWELPRHLYHFDKATLARLLEQAGFRVVRLRTGVGSLFFMASLERVWAHKYTRPLPSRLLWKLIERFVARPICLIAGHAGYGTEITVYAAKALSQPASHAQSTSAAASEAACG